MLRMRHDYKASLLDRFINLFKKESKMTVEELQNSVFTKYGLEMRTKPYQHQIDGLMKSGGQEAFAQLGEQGTGKTWILINEAAILFKKGDIDSILVLAPKGVDANWLNDELPRHMPIGIEYTAALWRANLRAKGRIALGKLLGRQTPTFSLNEDWQHPKDVNLGLRILLMNWDAISTEKGFEIAVEFMKDRKVMIICDEAQKVKKNTAKRAKALMKLREFSEFRRIATGTPITNSPFDAFSPFNFLSPEILDQDNFTAFKREYAKMIDTGSPLYQNLFKKFQDQMRAKGVTDQRKIDRMARRRVPQLMEKDANGKPMYRNLDVLHNKMQPYSFRVLKRECLDLPEKIYKKLYYDLSEEQQRVYEDARDNLRIWLDQETITNLTNLTVIRKLSQICSGFFIDTQEGEILRIPGVNPKQELLKDLMEDFEESGEKILIWAHLKAEIEDIKEVCEALDIEYVEYHGGIKDKERIEAIEAFQRGDAQVFIGHPKSGGTGLTLHAASVEIYYSNSYSMEDRVQSEDRAHRIGQKNNVTIIDLVATDTIEERFIQVLQDKSDLAALINGDTIRQTLYKPVKMEAV